LLALNANSAITTSPKISRSTPTDWSFKNIADSAKNIPCIEKRNKARRQYV
jgi:hypothetical protein